MAAAFRAGDFRGLQDGGATTLDSNSFTVQAGDTVYVAVGNSDGTPAAPSSVVWDPTGANQSFGAAIVAAVTVNTFGRFTVFRAQSLTAGTAVFRVTWPSNQGERAVIVWAGTGIDTTTPNGTIGTGGPTNSTSLSATATTTVGQLVLGIGYYLDTAPAGAINFNSPNGTERNEGNTSPTQYDGLATQDIAATGATQAITWTAGGGNSGAYTWYAVAIPLNDSSGPPSSDPLMGQACL